jgi:glutamyl-tRNA synthetase
VIRFRNPQAGWCSGTIHKGRSRSRTTRSTTVIVRADGIPTYNFAVVVDDCHAHQPCLPGRRARQQHALADQHLPRARCAAAGVRARADHPRQHGQLSKRRGAVRVTEYEDRGYLPEAMLNYLARLGWSHGDAEIFSREQMTPGSTAAISRRAGAGTWLSTGSTRTI